MSYAIGFATVEDISAWLDRHPDDAQKVMVKAREVMQQQ